MKKTILSSVALAATLFLSACGGTGQMLTNPSNTVANSPAATTGSSTSGLIQSLAGGLLGNLLGNTITLSPQTIAGTWNYSRPDCVFESENFLMKAGGEVAAAQIEAKVAPYLAKVGIKEGMSYTFNTDGTYTMTIGGRAINGQYTLDAENKTITMTFLAGLTQSTAKIAFTGTKLSLLYDADKLLAMVKGVSKLSGNSTVSTLSQLLDSYDGLLVGLELTK